MIESIEIRDFRGIRKGKIQQFRKINLLVGPNNSGKSALLEAIYLACTNSRDAGLIIDEYGSTNFSATIAERDLLGDHPMQRVLAKHNCSTRLEDLSNSEPGEIKVDRESRKVALSKFDFSSFGKLPKGDESLTATFGLELEDKGEADDRQRLVEIEQRIVNLMKDVDVLDESTHAAAQSEEQGLKQQVSRIMERLADRQEIIRRLARRLMSHAELGSQHSDRNEDESTGQESDTFEEGRLTYCWHPRLSYDYKGDAAWVVKGQLPKAQNTLFYDVSKVTGYVPLELFQRYFIEKPNLLRNIAESFRKIFDPDREITIQFLPSPEKDALLQGWIAPANQHPVPIDGYGDGARSTFKLLVALHILVDSVSDEFRGILIWEEPELFQNPRTFGNLVGEIVSLIRDKDIQLFVASHSLESVAHFTDLAVREVIDRESLLALRLSLSDGVLDHSWFAYDNLVAWLESGLDPRVWGEFKSPLRFTFREDEE